MSFPIKRNNRIVTLVASVDAKDELTEGTDTTRLARDGNGALLR